MRRVINYIRQCMCFHEFEVEDIFVYPGNKHDLQGEKRYLYCKKCGYHSNHWKAF